MKKSLIVIILSLTTICSCFAQSDDRFYFPSQEWHTIENSNYTERYFNIDKDTLHTVCFKTTTAPKATILFYHGNSGNISYNASFAKLLTEQGYQVFMTDFRGYGKSTGYPTHLNIAHDAQIIFDQIVDSHEFKNVPIIVYGASIGSQIATKITRDNKEKISALVIDGGMSSFTDMAIKSVPEAQKEMVAQYVTSPYSAKEDIKHVGSMPQLFIYGTSDTTVPLSQGEVVYNNAQGVKTLWTFDGGHLEAASLFEAEFIVKLDALFNEIE